MTDHVRPIGEFCWINVLSADPDGDRAFFAAVLGWTYREIPGMGHLILADDAQVGGIFRSVLPSWETVPAGIGVMVRVADADAAARRVRELGGHAEAPVAVGRGRMVDAADPSGAMLDLWEAGDDAVIRAGADVHGVPSWFELCTRDVPRALAFYSALFGWRAAAVPMPGGDYHVFSRGGAGGVGGAGAAGDPGVAGVMAHRPEFGPMAEYWAVYVTVRDVDAAARQALAMGGQVVVPPREIATVGRFAGVLSPGGVFCYVITYLPRS